jgi:hypothetical protein
VRNYVKAHDGLLLANHGALALAGDVMSAYYRMEDDRAFREDQPRGAHAGTGKPAVARRVDRLQGLRGMYGIASPAPICTDDSATDGRRSAGLPKSFKRRTQTIAWWRKDYRSPAGRH